MTIDKTPLKKALLGVQKSLEVDLDRAKYGIIHAPTKGGVAEKEWIDILAAYLPRRYEVSSGIIVDSKGGISDQIDIVIYDQQYTPVLLSQQGHLYIPVEAVYAIFETKPHIDKAYLDYAGQKAESVRALYRTSIPIAHAGGEYPAKKLFPIVAGIVGRKADWAGGLGEAFKNSLPKEESQILNCGCALTDAAFDSFNGQLEVVSGESPLMYFLFRLLGKLQSLGTVPAIDWMAYAKVVKATQVT